MCLLPPPPLPGAPRATAQRETSDVHVKWGLLPGAQTTKYREFKEKGGRITFISFGKLESSDATCKEPRVRHALGSAGGRARQGEPQDPAAGGSCCRCTVSCPRRVPGAWAQQPPGGLVSRALHGESGVLSPSPSPGHGILNGSLPPPASLSPSGNEGVGPSAPEGPRSCHTLWCCLLELL